MKNININSIEEIHNLPFYESKLDTRVTQFDDYVILFCWASYEDCIEKNIVKYIQIQNKSNNILSVHIGFIPEFIKHLLDTDSDLIESILKQMNSNSISNIYCFSRGDSVININGISHREFYVVIDNITSLIKLFHWLYYIDEQEVNFNCGPRPDFRILSRRYKINSKYLPKAIKEIKYIKNLYQ